jgi:dihydroorotate dehydrogenase (fumarate)
MMDLSTRYLGLTLSHPLVPGASPYGWHMDSIKRLEEAGAPVIQLPSLFEEQIANEHFRQVQDVDANEERYLESVTYFPRQEEYRRAAAERYLDHVQQVKEAVSAPVVASLNGTSMGGWVEFARYLEEAGADALELNVYFVSADLSEPCGSVEQRVVDITREIRGNVKIPIAVKLSQFFSSFPNLVTRLEDAGAAGVVFFNRFYQPDIDVEELAVLPRLRLSDSSELLLRLRFLAMLSGRVGLSLACTGGCHTGIDALKAVMCGADAVQIVSALLIHGPEHLMAMRDEMERWLEEHEYESLAEAKGSMGLEHSPDPAAFERGNYIRIIEGGVRYM